MVEQSRFRTFAARLLPQFDRRECVGVASAAMRDLVHGRCCFLLLQGVELDALDDV
jgi:hypothetical protein